METRLLRDSSLPLHFFGPMFSLAISTFPCSQYLPLGFPSEDEKYWKDRLILALSAYNSNKYLRDPYFVLLRF